MQILISLVLLDIGDLEFSVAQSHYTKVTALTTHFRIEGGLIQNDDALLTLTDGGGKLALGDNGKDLALCAEAAVITGEGGGGAVQTQVNTGPGQIAQSLTGLTGANTLLLHQRLELGLIHGHPLFLCHFNGQVDGEAVGVIELKGVGTGEFGLALFLVLFDHGVINTQTCINGLCEVFFLHTDDLGDIGFAFNEFRVCTLVLVDNRGNHLVEEALVDT